MMLGSPPFVSAMKFGHEWKGNDTSWTKTFAGKILEFPRAISADSKISEMLQSFMADGENHKVMWQRAPAPCLASK